MARGASTESAMPRVTMTRNRERSSSGIQGGSWWRKRAFFSCVEGGRVGVSLARTEGDRRISTQEQAVMPGENGSSGGQKWKGFRSTVAAFTLVREGLMQHLCKARYIPSAI